MLRRRFEIEVQCSVCGHVYMFWLCRLEELEEPTCEEIMNFGCCRCLSIPLQVLTMREVASDGSQDTEPT